jgi:hypothetical protein
MRVFKTKTFVPHLQKKVNWQAKRPNAIQPIEYIKIKTDKTFLRLTKKCIFTKF